VTQLANDLIFASKKQSKTSCSENGNFQCCCSFYSLKIFLKNSTDFSNFKINAVLQKNKLKDKPKK